MDDTMGSMSSSSSSSSSEADEPLAAGGMAAAESDARTSAAGLDPPSSVLPSGLGRSGLGRLMLVSSSLAEAWTFADAPDTAPRAAGPPLTARRFLVSASAARLRPSAV